MKIATLRDSTPGPLALKLHSNRDALGGKNDSFNANCNSHMLGGAAKIKRLPHDKAVAIRDILSRCDPDINASLQQTSTSPTSSQPQAASVPYVWKTTHRAHNKKYHAEHGNGSSTKLITKLTVEGLPSLRKNAEDPATFIEFQIDFKGWAMMNGAFQYTVGPPPAVPADAAAAATRLAKLAEGARYVCQSVADPDLRATVAAGAGNPPTGPAAFRALQEQFLQGTAEQPAIVAILDGMRLRRDQSVVAFRSRFTKMAAALDPAPADRILTKPKVLEGHHCRHRRYLHQLCRRPHCQSGCSRRLLRLCGPAYPALHSAKAACRTHSGGNEVGDRKQCYHH